MDDEVSIRKVLKRRLESWGYEVLLAADGERALERVDQDSPDLMVLDIMLPKMSGYDVLKALADRRRSKTPARRMPPPVVVLSAKGEGVRDLFETEGVVGYMAKPLDPQTLRTKIEEGLSAGNKEA